ncbi:MAG: SdrD B-like domain-containing protein [Steroidobacteraceae bacterium]
MALPAQASTCAPAATKGTAPSDYQTFCWLDFTGYNDALAQGGGQPFSFTLPDGSTLSMTLQVTTNAGNPALNAHAVPSWSGSAIGNSGFIGVPGNPVLYESQNGSTVTVVLNNINVTPPLGSGVIDTYAIVAADGESTNQNESLQFTTNGAPWAQVAQIPNGGAYPTVSGVGSGTVTETGVAGTVGAFAYASVSNPSQITAVMVGGGLQGAMFAVRYASMSVSAQFNGARVNAADQFIYSIKTPGGATLASGTTTGAGLGPFPAASVSPIAAGYPFVVTEAQAPGSVSPLADYAVSLTCTNQSTGGSSTAVPTNQATTSYTFPGLQYGDAISCLFTDTANRTNLTIAKSGPASVNAGAALAYTIVVSDLGPLGAAGALVQDPAVANFTATGVACTGASGGAVCPAIAQLTIASLQGAGIAIPTLPSGGAVTLVVSGTAGTANITNTAAITPPSGTINSNPTPTSTAATTVTAAADLATTLSFPATVNAGQPVSGTVLYTNNGPSTASGTTFTLSVAANLAVAPTLTGLPAGASFAYVPATGVITRSGMPATIAAGANVGPITVGYTQPGSATSTVSAAINATTTDPNPANNAATVTITGAAVADLATTLTFPATVNAGQPVSGTVLYTNNGPSTASGITFTLSVAANLSVAPTVTGLPAGASFAYVPATGAITLSGMPATLAAGANIGPIAVGYTQPGSATSTVSAAINATTTDPNPANNAATVTITGAAVADVAVKLTFPATVNAGQTVTGTVLYTNNGPSSASGPTFTLSVTANLAVAPTVTGLPAGASYTYVPATGAITLSGMPATIAAGATIGPIGVSYTQPGSATSPVSAAINATTTDPNPANNAATVTITGAAVADVAVKLTFPINVNAGQPVSGTVLYSNNGPSTASGPTFTLSVAANLAVAPTLTGLPAGASFAYVPATGAITLSGMPATLAAGANVGPISVGYTQPASGTSVVTASINSTTTDPNPANNSATVAIGGTMIADVATTLNFPATVNAGQAVAGTVLYTNNGPSSASGLTFTLSVAANLAVAPTVTGLPAGASFAYVPATGAITLSGMPATLAAGANVGPISVGYTQPAAATSTVTATVNSTTTDPNPANNAATATIGGAMVADVAVKLNIPATVNAGQPVSGTVLYTNNGPSTASGLAFNLSVATNLAVAPTLTGLPAGAAYTYAPATGVILLSGMPATLASGANVGPITVGYTQPGSATSTVSAAITTTTLDPNLANNAATATITGITVADVAAKLTFPATVNAGQPVSGTVLYGNSGPSTASGITYTLSVAANLAVAPTLAGRPAGASYAYVPATGVITLSGMPATLASGANVGPITVGYTQPGSATSTVSASINATTSDPDPANNSATVTIAGAAAADLATKLTFPAHANAGQSVAGTVLYGNSGPSTASGVTYTLSVAANLGVAPTVAGLPAGASYAYAPATGVITLSGMPSTLAAGANVGPISVGYTQPAAATSSVTAGMHGATTDPDPANNSATVTVTGITLADVAVKLNFPATANAGQPVTGTVLYTNNGPSTASGATFTLSVVADLAVAPVLTGLPAGATYSYAPATGVITLSGMPSTLASGASVGPINLSYTQPVSGKSTVHAAIASTTSDPDPANGSATLTITGAAAALSGMVFVDNNQDAIFDTGDSPVPGATVQLLSGTRLVASALTNGAGVYTFTIQAPGQYSLAVVPPKGFVPDTPSPVAVTLGGATPAAVNFGLIPAGAVGALVLTKSSPLVNISAGQSVPYTITARNSRNTPIQNSTVTDLMPAGFRFYAGSGAINGKKTNPTVSGRELAWSHLNFAPGETKTFTLVLTAGSGVGGGDYVNQASAYSGLTHGLISNLATATVRIVGDPTFDCPDLIGKVFDDANANGVQDPGEKGIAGVRLVTVQGLLVTTDAEGRYHIACPPIPNDSSASNFVVKVDERTLPSGYRLTTDNPETVVLTPGKVSKLNFGATIQHVERVEVNDAAYQGNALRPAVVERLDVLVASLKDQASIMRLAYEAADESDALVNARLQILKNELAALWKAKDCRYPLRIEEDIVRGVRQP